MLALCLRVNRVALPGRLHTASSDANTDGNTYIGTYAIPNTYLGTYAGTYAVPNSHTDVYPNDQAHTDTNAYSDTNPHSYRCTFSDCRARASRPITLTVSDRHLCTDTHVYAQTNPTANIHTSGHTNADSRADARRSKPTEIR